MEKLYTWLSSFILVLVLLMIGTRAYASDASQFNAPVQPIPSVQQLESQFESQLTTRQETYGQPRATSYYDDLVDHYEHDQLMFDVIGEGI